MQSTSLPAAGCVKENEEQDTKILKNSSPDERNANSTFLPVAGCVKENEEQDTKILKNNSPDERNANSTFLPAAECVKENEEQDKKTLFKLNSDQKLDLIKQAENQSSRELEKCIGPQLTRHQNQLISYTLLDFSSPVQSGEHYDYSHISTLSASLIHFLHSHSLKYKHNLF